MDYTIHKEVTINLVLTSDELSHVVSMLEMLDHEVLSKMPGDPLTSIRKDIIRELHLLQQEADR